MAGAVIVVEAGLPERPAGEGVDLGAGGADGKAGGGDGDMALQHAGEAVAHFLARLADRHGAGDVGGAVAILGAGIDQVERAGFEGRIRFRRNPVVDDGAVRPGAGDGVEG